MAPNFNPANSREVDSASERRIRAGDIEENTLQQGQWITLWSVTATRSSFYAPGSGPMNRQEAYGFADLDAQDSGSNAISGDFRFVLFESADEDTVLREGDTISADDLRSSKSASRTDKRVLPQMSPAASQDRVLAFQVKVDNGTNDGNTYSQSNSSDDLGIPYSKVSQ